jgi:hypothetical protein
MPAISAVYVGNNSLQGLFWVGSLLTSGMLVYLLVTNVLVSTYSAVW